MRDSAWYHKLWKKKFDRLPLHDSTEASWLGMCNLLDEKMPTVGVKAGINSPKFKWMARLAKLLKVVLPFAVVSSAVVYFNQSVSKHKSTHPVEKIRLVQKDTVAQVRAEEQSHQSLTDARDSSLIIKNKTIQQDHAALQDFTVRNNKLSKPLIRESLIVDSASRHYTKNRVLSAPLVNHLDNSRMTDLNLKRFLFNLPGQGSADINKVVELNTLGLKLNTLVFSAVDDKRTTVNKNVNGVVGTPAAINLGIASGNSVENKDASVKSKGARTKQVKNNMKIKAGQKIARRSFSYGIEAGINIANAQSFYAGVFGNYALKEKLVLGIGLNINSKRNISGEFTHPSYFRPDTPFTISDTRKIIVVDIPLTIGYRLSKLISLKAGPMLSLSLKQSEVVTKLMPIADPRDTVYHSKEIGAALAGTVMSKINVGFTGGINLQYKRFDINANYQWLSPYRINNSLGSTKESYQFFRLGLGYRFK